MPDWSKTEKTTTVVQYTVKADDKWGACWNEMELALSKAVKDWQDVHNGDLPSDDSIRVFPRDDAIIIEFNKPDEAIVGDKLRNLMQPTEEEIDDRAHAYSRRVAESSATHPDEPALLTKGGVGGLLRDAYRAGAFSMQSSRGASRYDSSGQDRRKYEEPCCHNSKPHAAHMYSSIGSMAVNCCGVS